MMIPKPRTAPCKIVSERVSSGANLLLILTLFTTVVSAGAGTFVVGDTNDTMRLTSLRGAIMAASRSGDHSKILLTGSDYQLTIPADLEIRGELEIAGGHSIVKISASGLGNRVLHILPGAQLKLLNLRITGGSAPGYGGGIYNEGALTMENCIVDGNSSWAGLYGNTGGNGICNAGVASLYHCTIANNSGGDGDNFCGFGVSGGNGGGVLTSGRMTLSHCMVTNNFAGRGGYGSTLCGVIDIGTPDGPGGAGGTGGGIYNSGQLDLISSAVVANSSGGGGNGGPSGGDGGNGGSGGGIYNSGIMSLADSTVTRNSAGKGGNAGNGNDFGGVPASGGNGGGGGGIFAQDGSSSHLIKTAVTLDSAGAGGLGPILGSTGSGPDLLGYFTWR